MTSDTKYLKRCFLMEERRIDIKILLRVLKIDTPCIIMTVMQVNAIWELYWPSFFKSAIQAELDLGLEDLGFWPSYFKLYGLGQVLLSVNRQGNTYFSGIIVRSKWDKPRKRSCEFVFSTVQVHIFGRGNSFFI